MSKKLKYQTAPHRHQTARTGQTENLLPLLLSMLNQRETRAELPHLDPQRAIELYEDYRKGIMADVQLAFDEMESYDDDLATVVDKRQRALEQMPWQVEIDSAAVGDDATRTALAQSQQAYLQQRFNAIENLEEAITYLGMADFHGVAALELTGNQQRGRWEIIEPWLLARPARRGPWYYNPEARRSYTEVEELDPAAVIIREARPITLVCMWLVVAKHHAIHGWDEFLEVFGNPSIFAELPPGTSEESARVLDEMVKRIVSDGRGTVPTGTKFTTVETGQNNCAAFQERARWCKEAIITVATGGQLTVLAEPGSGTLAGGAHSDSFESLCAGTAAAISAVINKQWVRRILAEKWPQQPALAKFTLAPEPADERAAMADLLGKLTAAGYELETDEAASDLVTLPLRRIPQQPGMSMPSAMPAPGAPAAPQPTRLEPIANRAATQVEETEEEATLTVEEEGPLTDDELAAFHSLGKPNFERMNQRRQEVQATLLAAADLGAGSGKEEVEIIENGKRKCRAKNPATCVKCNPSQKDFSQPDADPETAKLPRPQESAEPEGGWEDEEEDPYADNPGWDAETNESTDTTGNYTHPNQMKKTAVYGKAATKQKLGVYKQHAKQICDDVDAALGLPPKGSNAKVRETSAEPPIEGIGEVKIYGSTVKEMLNYNAVQSSLVNGVEYPVHVEAVTRTKELLPSSRITDDYPGRKNNDRTEHVYVLSSDFEAQDGKPYTARYTVHKMKEGQGPPKLYFMDCARR